MSLLWDVSVVASSRKRLFGRVTHPRCYLSVLVLESLLPGFSCSLALACPGFLVLAVTISMWFDLGRPHIPLTTFSLGSPWTTWRWTSFQDDCLSRYFPLIGRKSQWVTFKPIMWVKLLHLPLPFLFLCVLMRNWAHLHMQSWRNRPQDGRTSSLSTLPSWHYPMCS